MWQHMLHLSAARRRDCHSRMNRPALQAAKLFHWMGLERATIAMFPILYFISFMRNVRKGRTSVSTASARQTIRSCLSSNAVVALQPVLCCMSSAPCHQELA